MKYISSIINRFKHLNSYLFGTRLRTYQSELNGCLEIWMIDGKKVLNSKQANQSYDSLHYIFQTAFKKLNLNARQPKNVLLLGLGGGSIPTILAEEMGIPCHITAVEYDPMMIEIAQKEFNINRIANLKIVLADAVDFVNHCQEKYDLIIVDIFNDDQVPLSVQEEEFNINLLACLSKGLLLFNFINHSLSQGVQFEKLQFLYNMQRGILVSNYHIQASNEILVVEKSIA